jgi:Ca2+-binding EF-hand superfamily protein
MVYALLSSIRRDDANSKLRQEAAAVFKKYDANLTGSLTRQDFAKLHRELQREKLVKQNLDNCIMQLDENGDGMIQFNEFITWIEKVLLLLCLHVYLDGHVIRECYRAYEPAMTK